nr:nonribosomal peptide synthetase 1 [Quercus suber]
MLTPSFVRTLNPDSFTHLETLVLGGEAPTVADLKSWCSNVRLFNGYGPAETCNYASSFRVLQIEGSSRNIGRGCNTSLWIVDPNNHDRLAPVGCTGELLIQGPGLAREYLKDKEKTARMFINSPSWLPSGLSTRLYKTGDLVRYNDDGTIDYIGRKDMQMKIRGQRVEPGEVEQHVKQYLGSRSSASVQAVQDAVVADSAALVVFTCMDTQAGTVSVQVEDAVFLEDGVMMETMRGLDRHLRTILPDYMVPTHYLPVQRLPLTSSGKIDGQFLHRAVLSLTAERLAQYSISIRGEIRAPVTVMERALRDMWAEVLGLPAEEIGRDDSFLQIGGDSISAIRLVAAARGRDIQLTVSSIFKDPRLSQVAMSAASDRNIAQQQLEPWSLVPETHRRSIDLDVREQCKLAPAPGQIISDIYPTTAFQEGLMALAVKRPGSYVARHTFELAEGVDAVRFKVAWEQTVQTCTALRTRIFLSGDSSWQTVIDEEPGWGKADDLASYMAGEETIPTEYGSALCRYALVPEGLHMLFCLTLHHAIFDGWSFGLIMRTLSSFYDGSTPAQQIITPYVSFVKYAREIDSARASEYWRAQLEGATTPTFPRQHAALPTAASESPPVSASFSHKISLAALSSSSITMATVLRAAWAIVLARYNDSADDITFGATVAGRQAPVAGIENIVGPVLSTVPIRVKLLDQEPVAQYLRGVQAQGVEMIPFEQTGLQNIAKLGSYAHAACSFSTLLIIQPRTMLGESNTSLLVTPSADLAAAVKIDMAAYFTYPLVVQCSFGDEEVLLYINYNSSILSATQAEAMARQYEYVVQQLCSIQCEDTSTATLDDVRVCGPSDIERVLQWNAAERQPVVVDACVHDLISATAAESPQHEAIFAWDGQCTYAELDQMSTALAIHLRMSGDWAGVSRSDLLREVDVDGGGHARHHESWRRLCAYQPGSSAESSSSTRGWAQSTTDAGIAGHCGRLQGYEAARCSRIRITTVDPLPACDRGYVGGDADERCICAVHVWEHRGAEGRGHGAQEPGIHNLPTW